MGSNRINQLGPPMGARPPLRARLGPVPPAVPSLDPAGMTDTTEPDLTDQLMGIESLTERQRALADQLGGMPSREYRRAQAAGNPLGSLIGQIRDSRNRHALSTEQQANVTDLQSRRAHILHQLMGGAPAPLPPADLGEEALPAAGDKTGALAQAMDPKRPIDQSKLYLLAASEDPVLSKYAQLQLQGQLQRDIHTKVAPQPKVDPNADAKRAKLEADAAAAKAREYRLMHPIIRAAKAPVKPEETVRGKALTYKQAQNTIPGFDGPPLLPTEKEKIADQIAARDRLLSTIDGIKKIYEPRDVPFSSKRAALKTKLMELKPQISATAGFPFTQGHQDMIEQGIANPNQLETWLNEGYLPTQLDEMSSLANDAVEKTLAARHLTPSKGPAKVAGSTSLETPPIAPHPQDSAAVAWAKKHPDDPRSEQILGLNGAQ